MANYIVLANSDASNSKRFRVVHGTYSHSIVKQRTRRRTITGKVHIQEGPNWNVWQMTIQLLQPDPGGNNYGTHRDLWTFFGYSDPTTTPSDAITFTDPAGATFTVRMTKHEEIRRLGTTWDQGEPTHIQIVLEEA